MKERATILATMKTYGEWLETSETIMFNTESELMPTEHQLHLVGVEWAGTLSRLE